MKTTLILSLCVLFITEEKPSNANTQTQCAIVFSAERCDQGNWRTYSPRTWLDFSEDGRTVTLRTNQRIPQMSVPSVEFRQTANISEHLNTTSTRLPAHQTLLVDIPF